MRKYGAVFIFCFVPFIFSLTALAADKVFLGDRHVKEFGLECSGCHGEKPPAKAVATEKCVTCHGSLEDIGENTELKDLPNPHINHNDLYCEDCHKGHKPPENYCNGCHDFNYRIP